MKEQIQQLISTGQTEEALQLLVKSAPDAILLQARYNQGKKQYNMGLIEFGEWSRIQAQINYAALELAGSVKAAVEQVNAPAADPRNPVTENEMKVFLSYNHQDSYAMRAIKSYLEENGIRTYIDLNDMSAGASIQSFIDEALKKNYIVLTIVSRNSLLSGWVYQEMSVAQQLHQTQKNWIPVSIDDAVFNENFYFEALSVINKRINELADQVKKALNSGLDIRPYTDDLNRQQDLKANLGKTISNLKSIFVVDISGKLFDVGMAIIVRQLKEKQNAR